MVPDSSPPDGHPLLHFTQPTRCPSPPMPQAAPRRDGRCAPPPRHGVHLNLPSATAERRSRHRLPWQQSLCDSVGQLLSGTVQLTPGTADYSSENKERGCSNTAGGGKGDTVIQKPCGTWKVPYGALLAQNPFYRQNRSPPAPSTPLSQLLTPKVHCWDPPDPWHFMSRGGSDDRVSDMSRQRRLLKTSSCSSL